MLIHLGLFYALKLGNQIHIFCAIVFLFTQSYQIQIIFKQSSWPTDGTLTGTTTLGQSWPESNANEGMLHTP